MDNIYFLQENEILKYASVLAVCKKTKILSFFKTKIFFCKFCIFWHFLYYYFFIFYLGWGAAQPHCLGLGCQPFTGAGLPAQLVGWAVNPHHVWLALGPLLVLGCQPNW